MLTFLFWNINRKPLASIIANLTVSHDVDVLVLVECEIGPARMLRTLNDGRPAQFHFSPDRACDRIAIYTRFPGDFLEPLSKSPRTTIRRLSLPARTEILLAAAHLPSKLHWEAGSQASECALFAQDVRDVEEQIGHSRTILVGDLNMDPYEDGLIAASALNAVMTRQLALRGRRTVQGRKFPFFYNPMWGLFGDAAPGPPGTYYYESSQHVAAFWHIFDQVLIRPELLDRFHSDSLRILDENGGIPFLNDRGLPDASAASDHLPVLFQLDL